MLGQAGEDVFGGKETRKMLPDDFMCVVAEDAFRPGVPAEEAPFQSDQEEGVLLGVRRQQIEALSHFLGGETGGIV